MQFENFAKEFVPKFTGNIHENFQNNLSQISNLATKLPRIPLRKIYRSGKESNFLIQCIPDGIRQKQNYFTKFDYKRILLQFSDQISQIYQSRRCLSETATVVKVLQLRLEIYV